MVRYFVIIGYCVVALNKIRRVFCYSSQTVHYININSHHYGYVINVHLYSFSHVECNVFDLDIKSFATLNKIRVRVKVFRSASTFYLYLIHSKLFSQMEEKLQELQNKLADEESERKAMSISMSEMTEKQSAEKSILIKVCLLTDVTSQNNIRYNGFRTSSGDSFQSILI